jgi:hypothetical protein
MAKAPKTAGKISKVGGWGKAGVKRPHTAYNIYTTNLRAKLRVSNPEVCKDISKFSTMAAEKWAKMTDKEKLPFVNDALKERDAAVILLTKAKDAQKAERLVERTKLPEGWKRVLATETTREYYINKDADLILFGKPYTVEEGQSHMTPKPKKTKNAK